MSKSRLVLMYEESSSVVLIHRLRGAYLRSARADNSEHSFTYVGIVDSKNNTKI